MSKKTKRKASEKTASTEELGPQQIPRMVLPNTKSVQVAIDQVVSTLNDPDYKAQITKLTQMSVNNSVQTAQKLSKITARMSKLNNEEMTTLVSNSVSDMMRLYLQFNSELITLMQKVSNRAVEILESATPTSAENQAEPMAE